VLYVLFKFALRPFRRWWRRVLVAAVVGTMLVPAARQYVSARLGGHPRTVTLPSH